MGQSSKYTIDLKSVRSDTYEDTILLDDAYFASSDMQEIHSGNVGARVRLRKTAGLFDIHFDFKGEVLVTCDRCLDDLRWPVDTTAHLVVKLGESYEEESEEILVLPMADAVLDMSWLLYEYIELSLPFQRVHADGMCNPEMIRRLGDFALLSQEDQGQIPVSDGRWDTLKELRNLSD